MNELADRIRTLKALTQQQRRVLELLCEEMTYRQIGAALGRGVSTEQVELQAAHVFTKLGITARPNRGHHDDVRRYSQVFEFLDAHRKPPAGMSESDIQEIRHAPDDGREPAPPRWALALARQYGEELEGARSLPAIQRRTDATAGSPGSPAARTPASPIVPWAPPAPGVADVPPAAPPPAHPPPRSGWSQGQLFAAVAAVAVIALLGGALLVTLLRPSTPPVAPSPVVIVATQAPPPTPAPQPTQPPPAQAPAKAAQPTPTAVPTVVPTPARRIQQVNQPMKIAANRASGENPETVQYVSNTPFLLDTVEVVDDSTMIWQFSVQNKNGSDSFYMSQPNAPRPYVLSSEGQKYDATSGYRDIDNLVPGEKRTFVLSFKAPTKGSSYKVAIETVVSRGRNPSFWNFYLWESPLVSMP